MAASAVNPALPQQEGKQLLALAPKIVSRRLTGPHKIAHRLMGRVRRPNPCQLPGPMQSRVAPVRLDALARPFRDQGRSDHHAIVAEGMNLAVKPVSRRPSFKADMRPLVSVRQSLDRPLDRQRTVLDIAEKADLPGPAAFRDRHGVLLLRDVKSDKSFAILPIVRPPCMRLGSACPSNPRSYLHERAGHR